MDQSIFKKRRKEFLKRITVMGGGLVILAAGTEQERNPEVNHEFRQDSNFYYLTGSEQPDAIAVFDPKGRKPYTLFVHPRDPKKELWLGPSVGPEEAVKRYGADQASPISDLRLKILDLFSGATTIWPHTHSRKDISDMIHDTIGNLRRNGVSHHFS